MGQKGGDDTITDASGNVIDVKRMNKMDEPTGHLDKFNIAWLIDYVNSLKSREKPVTVIAVSHDTEYLEKTTTHILEFENRKLNTFRGNITEFVKKNPEAKIYFEITKSAKVQ